MWSWLTLPVGWVVHWDLWVRLAQAIAWPVIALLGLASLAGPVGKLIEKFADKLGNADEVALPGGIILKNTQSDIAKAREGLNEDDQQQRVERGDAEAPAFETPMLDEAAPVGDWRENISDGWARLEGTMIDAISRVPAPNHIRGYARTNTVLALNWLVEHAWIGFPLRDSIKALSEARDTLSAATPRGREVAELRAQAVEFRRTAYKASRSLLNAISYRLNKHQPAAQIPPVAGGDPNVSEAVH